MGIFKGKGSEIFDNSSSAVPFLCDFPQQNLEVLGEQSSGDMVVILPKDSWRPRLPTFEPFHPLSLPQMVSQCVY